MPRVTVISPKLSLPRYLSDLCAYAELLVFLAGRDLAVRYKQTVAGILWAVLVPLLTVVALSFVFGRVAKLHDSTFLLVYAGMIPWQFFSTALQTGGTSLLNNTPLVTKLYFPRLILPLSSLGVAFVDLALNVLILLGLLPFFGEPFSPRLLSLPLWVLLGFYVSIGPTLIVASALVRYRDLRFLLPFVVQFGLFVTPVGYVASVVPAALRPIFNLNPLVGVIDGMRWAIAHASPFPTASLGLCLLVSTLLFLLGGALFLGAEKTMADEI